MTCMDVRAIGWSGIVQITAFAGAPFYSLGLGLGKHGRRGIFGRKIGAVRRPRWTTGWREGARIRARQIGCWDPGLRRNLRNRSEPDAGGQRPIERHARRLIIASCAPRLLPLV